MAGLTVVAVVAIAMPAVGASPTSLASKALKTAKGADKTAKKANKTAKAADKRAKSALSQIKAGVPKATSATTAQNAVRATSAGSVDTVKSVGPTRVAASAANDDDAVARAAATEVPLGTSGPFTFYGKCYVDSNGGGAGVPETIANTFIRTSENGAIVDSDESTIDGNPFLDIATLEADRQISGATAANNGSSIDADDNADFSVVAPSGARIRGHLSAAAKTGTLPGGDGIYGAGNACVFWSDLIS